jgi:hypothetical protein
VYLPLNCSGAALVSGKGIVSIEFPGTVKLAMIDRTVNGMIHDIGYEMFINVLWNSNGS